MHGEIDQRTSAKFEQIALVLLAAGHSRRFGSQKLRASLAGKALAHHAAATFSQLPFGYKIAVVGGDDLDLPRFGFTCFPVRGDDYPMSISLARGIAAASATPARSVMIALADMPFVSAEHIVQLVERFRGSRIASSTNRRPMPPAIFGAQWFGRLGSLSGDKGARALLDTAPQLAADAAELADIDFVEDLLQRKE